MERKFQKIFLNFILHNTYILNMNFVRNMKATESEHVTFTYQPRQKQ